MREAARKLLEDDPDFFFNNGVKQNGLDMCFDPVPEAQADMRENVIVSPLRVYKSALPDLLSIASGTKAGIRLTREQVRKLHAGLSWWLDPGENTGGQAIDNA